MPEPYYASADDLRTKLGVDATVLPDAAAIDLIVEAEDTIDRLVGPKAPDLTTGRKYTVPGAGWDALAQSQRDSLTRATVLLAAAVYNEPAAFDPPTADLVQGPDFKVQGARTGTPAGQKVLIRVAAILDDANLRVRTARMREARAHC